jgi:hypothetical protein
MRQGSLCKQDTQHLQCQCTGLLRSESPLGVGMLRWSPACVDKACLLTAENLTAKLDRFD